MQAYKSRWGTDALHTVTPHSKMFAVKNAYGNGVGSLSMSAMSERMNTAGGLREGRPPRGKLLTNTQPPRKSAEQERDKERSQALVLQVLQHFGDSVVNGSPVPGYVYPGESRGSINLRREGETPDHIFRVGSGDSVDTVAVLDHLVGRNTKNLSRLSSSMGGNSDGGRLSVTDCQAQREGGREGVKEPMARRKGNKDGKKGVREDWERRMERREGVGEGQCGRGSSVGTPAPPRNSAKEVMTCCLGHVCWRCACFT